MQPDDSMIHAEYRVPAVWMEPWPIEASWSHIAEAINKNAVAHGFWDETKYCGCGFACQCRFGCEQIYVPRNLGECLALQHSEISEAYEAFCGDEPFWSLLNGYSAVEDRLAPTKPVGAGSELVDVIIRCLDLMHHVAILRAGGIGIGTVANDVSMAIRDRHFAMEAAALADVRDGTDRYLSLDNLHFLVSRSLEYAREHSFALDAESAAGEWYWGFMCSQANVFCVALRMIEIHLVAVIPDPSRNYIARRMIQVKHSYNINRPHMHGKAF